MHQCYFHISRDEGGKNAGNIYSCILFCSSFSFSSASLSSISAIWSGCSSVMGCSSSSSRIILIIIDKVLKYRKEVCTLIGNANSVKNFALDVWACFYSYQSNSFCKMSHMIGSTYKTLKIEFWHFSSGG